VSLSLHTQILNKCSTNLEDQFDQLLSLGWRVPLPPFVTTLVPLLSSEIANSNPKRIAITCNSNTISFKEHHKWALKVADKLTKNGITPGSRVSILIEPSSTMVAGAL
jgi:hypothetical protein